MKPDTEAIQSITLTQHIQSLTIIIVGLVLIALILRGLTILAKPTRIPPLALRPLRFLVRWLGILVIAGTVMSVYGFNLMTIISTVLAMIAIGFVAVWSILSNISCTFLLVLFRAFKVGDEIEFAGEPVKGRVVDLNLLFTTLKDAEGHLFQVPNSLFFQKVLRRKEGKGTIELGQQLHEDKPAE